MKKLILVCAAVLAVHSLFAQKIIGKLVNNTNKQAVEYASVALYQTADSALIAGTVSDAEGNFELSNLKPGSYYMTAQFVGFKRMSRNDLKLVRNQDLNLGTLVLLPSQKLLEEIEVRGEKAVSVHKIDRQVFKASEFQAAQGGTATDLIKNMPSVNVNGEGAITVRGTSGFTVLLNGKPIQSDPSMILNQLSANSIENIEIITAPSAKFDPEGKAGIINIITKKGAADGLYIQINAKVGLPSIEGYDNKKASRRYGGDFILNYRKDKWDLSLSAGYDRDDLAGRREGEVYTIINNIRTNFNSDGERSFNQEKYTGQLTLGYTPNKNNRFSLGFYAGKRNKDRQADILYYDNHAIDLANNQRLYTMQYYNENLRIRRSDFVLAGLDYEHIFGNKSKLSTSFLYEYTMLGGPTTNLNLDWPDTRGVQQDEYNTNDNPLKGIRLKVDYQSKPLPAGTIEAGYQYRSLDHTGDFVYERRNLENNQFELVPDFSSTVNLNREIHSFYGQLSGKKGKLSYGAGMRVELMDRKLWLKDKLGSVDSTYLYDFVKLYPSANLQYEVSDNFKIKAAYSKRVSRTTTFKMNPFREREHSETMEQGDAALLPEFIDLVELGVVKNFGDNSVYMTAYFRNVENLVNRVNKVYNDTILDRIYSNVGNARAYGVEFGAELKPTKWWKIFAGANIYQFTIDGAYNNEAIKTSSGLWSFNGNTTFKISPTFNIQGSLNYLSARNTAQGEDSRYLSPSVSFKKTFLNGRLSANVQWLNFDMGMLPTNEQRISTWREGSFYTTTNYVYEVDMILVNLSFLINKVKSKATFIESEFGENEF